VIHTISSRMHQKCHCYLGTSVGKSKRALMKRRYLSLSLALVTALATAVLALSPHPDALAQSPTTDQFHISASTVAEDSTSIEIASDHWSARGYDLKALIAEIYSIDPQRIDLPNTPATTARYDVSLQFPEDASQEQIQHLLQQALQKKFKITITPEARSMEVYVMTAPKGPGPALHLHSAREAPEGMDHFSYQARVCPGISSGGISASAGTIAEFRRTLEPTLDRPIVNETNLPGAYDFQIGQYRSKEELFQLLRDQLGLVATPSRRDIQILAVHLQQSSL
jgi:uncharacterized protein (TIGR03435 family)